MNTPNSRLSNIIRYSVITEKTHKMAQDPDQKVMTFRVLPDATKDEIKTAAEKLLGLQVEKVHTINMQGKVRRNRRGIGRRSDWKKAYVTLVRGTEVDVEQLSENAAAAEENKGE